MTKKNDVTEVSMMPKKSWEKGRDIVEAVNHFPLCTLCEADVETKEIDLHPGPKGSNIQTLYTCPGIGCLFGYTYFDLKEWNRHHGIIRSLQRDAFDEGFNNGCDYETGHEYLNFESWLKCPRGENKKVSYD